ncbi:MAG: dephospho-CoA kinase [candidate division Zixibacteria bacterium]
MIIGITGQIGGGKSTAAQILSSFGGMVIDADLIGRRVVDESDELKRQIGESFGEDIFDSEGRLLRSLLAERAFRSEQTTVELNAIVHPFLLAELRKRIKAAAELGHVIVDAALLLFWGMGSEVDLVLVIHAGLELRLKRLVSRGISPADAQARQAAQLPFRDFQKRADILILNSGTRTDLKRKLKTFWEKSVS